MPEDNGSGRSRGLLPIKLILPNQGRERLAPVGGGPPVPFRPVDRKYRERLGTQVAAMRLTITSASGRLSVAPMRVKLLAQASAKSHRPERLFSRDSCPIIGAGRLGELFVKASVSGLERLAREIERNESGAVVKEISSIEVVEPITQVYRRRGQAPIDILRHSPRGKKGFVTRVRLFDFGAEGDQRGAVEDFFRTCETNGLEVTQAGYSPRSYVYAVECGSVEDVEALSKSVGVRSVCRMPIIGSLKPKMFNPQSLPDGLPRADDIDGDFPVVVVVDTGVSEQNSALQSWVVGRESYVSPQYRNPDHGTFVGGLVCWGAHLNPHLSSLSGDPCGLYDLQVIPNGDPARGETDSLTESEFLQTLETALKQHANKFKVWNLSLGSDEVCSIDEFSPLAEQLDNRQEKYQVSFVVSAGNYDSPPLLDYPRTGPQLEAGRITAPADSVLGITVGSISHVDYRANGPREHHPSAFSRHGAGPNYIIKPDLVHYGGTCTTDLSHRAGVRSTNGVTSVEDLGTSFSTPLVSSALAHVYHRITPTPSPVLARALLTHHARDPRTEGRVPDGEENFLGFGRPSPPPYCIECTPHSSTLVFEDTLRPGYYLEWDDFPYPRSLARNGRHYGEIWMTVAFAPARGARWGTEYCETHIDAHFGVYREHINRETGDVTEKFHGLVPPEHKNPGVLYESYRVKELRKWAPVRTYYGDLGPNGESGLRWRLMVRLLARHGIEDQEAFKPQPFSLIITVSDPLGLAPVYDEMAQVVLHRFKAENLTLRAAARLRARA